LTLTILYHDPQQPHERGMTMIAAQVEAAAMIDRLEQRGFVVEKITLVSVAGISSQTGGLPAGTFAPDHLA